MDVTIREFTINTSKYLKGGTTITITKHGKPYLILSSHNVATIRENVATNVATIRENVATFNTKEAVKAKLKAIQPTQARCKHGTPPHLCRYGCK